VFLWKEHGLLWAAVGRGELRSSMDIEVDLGGGVSELSRAQFTKETYLKVTISEEDVSIGGIGSSCTGIGM